MLAKFFNSLSKISSDYISITVSEPYALLKKHYALKSSVSHTRFSIGDYIKRQNQMTSPEVRKGVYVHNSELRKTYIRDFSSDSTLH